MKKLIFLLSLVVFLQACIISEPYYPRPVVVRPYPVYYRHYPMYRPHYVHPYRMGYHHR